MPATIIDVDPIAPGERARYTRHSGDEVTEQFAAELEPLLVAHGEGGPFTSDELMHGRWLGRVDQVNACVSQLVGMPPNGLLSRSIPDVGGVLVWTQATWHDVTGLVARVTWRTQWLDYVVDMPVTVVKPDYDITVWAPIRDSARRSACRASGNALLVRVPQRDPSPAPGNEANRGAGGTGIEPANCGCGVRCRLSTGVHSRLSV